MEPRKPTQKEKDQFIKYLKANDYGDLSEAIDSCYMAVFDKYQTDYPGYVGRLLVIVATHNPCVTEVYIWPDGNITRVTEEMFE